MRAMLTGCTASTQALSTGVSTSSSATPLHQLPAPSAVCARCTELLHQQQGSRQPDHPPQLLQACSCTMSWLTAHVGTHCEPAGLSSAKSMQSEYSAAWPCRPFSFGSVRCTCSWPSRGGGLLPRISADHAQSGQHLAGNSCSVLQDLEMLPSAYLQCKGHMPTASVLCCKAGEAPSGTWSPAHMHKVATRSAVRIMGGTCNRASADPLGLSWSRG